MKKFTSLLIGVSLALAGAAFAQQPEEQATPGPGKKGAERTHATEKAGANLAKPEATVKESGAKTERPGKVPKTDTATQTGVSGQTGASATTEPGTGKAGRKAKATEKSATAT